MNIDILHRPTALENLLAGRIWPAGRRLPMHALKGYATLKSSHESETRSLVLPFPCLVDYLNE